MSAARVCAVTAAAITAAAVASVAVGGVEPAGRSLNVRVDWVTPGPDRVSFDGGPPFEKMASYFVKPLPLGRSAAVHDVAVAYSQFQVPLRLIASPGRAGDIQFTVTAPVYASCERSEVNKVAQAAPTGTIEERLALLISARRLIGLCANVELELPKLVRKYYEVSCSLAGDRNSFFAIHADATERFSKLARTRHTERTLTDCRGRGVGPELRRTWQAAQAAQARGDSATVAMLTDDLLAKSSDDAWQEGFEAEMLTPRHVRELKVIDLKARQNGAASEEDFDRAIDLNDELQALRDEPEYASVFSSVGVSEELLVTERADFEVRQAASASR